MTQATSQDYWISPQALYIVPNTHDDPNYIQASCVSGANILVYIRGIIDYDAGHNYRRWPLTASPTMFGSNDEKYIYVAVPRYDTVQTAFVAFPSEEIDIYGMNNQGEQVGSENYYYISLGASLTSSGDNGTTPRKWKDGILPVTGELGSNKAIDDKAYDSLWYQYSPVSQVVTFLKDITMAAGKKFLSLCADTFDIDRGGKITFNKATPLTGVATPQTAVDSTDKIVTPSYVDSSALSKRHDDKTDYDLEMKNLKTNGAAIIGGQLDVFGNFVAAGSAVVKGGLSVGSVEHPSAVNVFGGVTTGLFNKGVSGSHVDFYGNAEYESIIARTFLEVPEIRYNRTTITVGNKWQTVGAGIIEKVWRSGDIDDVRLSEMEGIAMLKLEDGEPGAIAKDDKCQGVFHFTSKSNDSETSDEKNGNFHFKGFTTVYFVITQIYTDITLPGSIHKELDEKGVTAKDNQFFRYELRAATCAYLSPDDPDYWKDNSHPQPTMNFACYANARDAQRQASRLTTTTYQIHLAGMTGWTYNNDNIRLIIGWLDGFMLKTRVWNREEKRYEDNAVALQGEGVATGNMYMWGNINQFDRAPSLISQQQYFRATSIAEGIPEGIIINATHTVYDLNGWQQEPIIPADTDTRVWTQLLYLYSDNTYDVSAISLGSTPGTKGDKGDKGEPGTSIKINGTALKYYASWVAYYEDEEKQSGIYLVQGKTEGNPPISKIVACIYTYDADSDTTDISTASDNSMYSCKDDGHIYSASHISGGLNPKSEWVDLGKIRGADAVVYALDIPDVILKGTEDFNIKVVKTVGDVFDVLSYEQAVADGITVDGGSYVEWNEQDQQFYLDGGAVDGKTYNINLKHNGYILKTYAVQCIGNGKQGYDGCVVRRSEWQEGVYYHNDQMLTPQEAMAQYGDGTRYIDEVSITDLANPQSSPKWFVANPAHNGIKSSQTNRPPASGSNDWWQAMNNEAPLRTSFADIMTAFIQFLQVSQITIEDADHRPYGAFGAGEYPLWFGGQRWQEARVRFHQQGYTEYLGTNNKPNIRIGTDTDGTAVLKFFDDAGNEKYNLGYMGLKEIIATAMQDHYEPFASSLRFIANDPSSIIPVGRNIRDAMSQPQETLYRFLCSYFIDQSGQKVKAGDYVSYDDHIYEYQDRTPDVNTIIEGTYVFFGSQPRQTPSGLNKYVIHFYRIASGTLRETWTRYYDFDDDGRPVLYDAQGSEPLADQTLYSRDYWS